MKKQCNRCSDIKHLDEFYGHKQAADGKYGSCKDCVKKASAERHARIEADPQMRVKEMRRQREKSRKYRAEGKNKTLPLKREVDTKKKRANAAVGNAIRNGKLSRKSCFICGMTAQAHHEDYSKPLDIVWLCVTHHSARHTYMHENEILGRKPEPFAKWAKNPREQADL